MSGREGDGWGVGQKSGSADALLPASVPFADFFIGDGNFDLFGGPYETLPRPVGRPRHVATEEKRRKVSSLVKDGLRHDQIAVAIGVSAPTLRLIYFQELGSRSQTGRRRDARDAARSKPSK